MKRLLIPVFISLIIAGCGSSDAVRPTTDPCLALHTMGLPECRPPTPTGCEVKCNVGTEDYNVEITCESGQATTSYNDSTSFEGQVTKVKLDQERTYEDTGNTYKIVGEIVVDRSIPRVNYKITITGGIFKETPQICKK